MPLTMGDIFVLLSGPYVVLFVGPLLRVRFLRGRFTRYNVTVATVAVLVTAIQLALLVHNGRLAADFHQTVNPAGGPPQVAGQPSGGRSSVGLSSGRSFLATFCPWESNRWFG